MAKSLIDETFDVYMQMRLGGKDAKASLEALRFRIGLMPSGDQAELVRRAKAWEGKHMGRVTAPAPAPNPFDAPAKKTPPAKQPPPAKQDPPSFSKVPPAS